MAQAKSEREIKTISLGKAMRSRLGMYLSGDLLEALFLGLREIYVNSLDALIETDRTSGMVKINIDSKKREVEVEDNGPGILIKDRDDGSHSLVAAYTIGHTGSHFNEAKTNAIGLNGIGAKVVNNTASYFEVISDDGEKMARAIFFSDEEGAQLKDYHECNSTHNTGVKILYQPDSLIYGEEWFDREALISGFSEMMKFYPKYKLIFNMDGYTQTFYYPEGLHEKSTILYYESENLILSLNTDGGGVRPYGNRLYLPQGGNFVSHFKTQLTKNINEITGLKLRGDQIHSLFGGYIAIFVSPVLFSNQSKTSISNKEVNPEITQALRSEMEKFVKTPAWEKILKNLEAEAKAEAAAERAREKVLKAKKDFADKKINTMSEKFCDADWKNRSECRLFLGEGASATSPIRRVKWPFDATMELRGKVLNCEREGWDRIIENKELMMISKALGATITDTGFLLPEKNFRFGSIILAADDDPDGNHIINLLLAFFYRYFPQVVKRGMLQIIKPALFHIVVKGENKFFGSEAEMKEWCKRNKVKPAHINRYKGRGSLGDDLLKQLIDPKKGEFYKITLNDAKAAAEAIKLMSNDVSSRKELIEKDFVFDWGEEI